MRQGSVSVPDGRARRGRRVAAAIFRGIAAIGILLVAWAFGFMGYLFDGYWAEPVGAALLVLGAGRLLWRRRWEGFVVGGCCWIPVSLVLGIYGSSSRASAVYDRVLPVLLYAVFAITLVANAWAAVKWLLGLPMPRPQMVAIVCFLSAAVVLTAKPYWVARYRGRAADLRGAVLLSAYLDSADLRSADLSGANLTGAWLAGAKLNGANLRGAKFGGVVYSGKTKWPDGFDPTAHGARMAFWHDDGDDD